MENIINQIIKYGRKVEKYALISSHAGNISVRDSDSLYITKTGTMLGELSSEDIVNVSIFGEHPNLKFASMETIVHRAIYQTNNYNSIIHSHPVYAITLSLLLDSFIPIDSEGKFVLGKIPILSVKNSIASEEVASGIKNLYTDNKVVIVRSHGVFAVGDSLEKAFYYTTVLENSAKIFYLTKLWKKIN